ncbi:MAG: Fe-S-binding domain-containing protein, partial [Phycisphaerales bacterium]|nr:Fe-S-binding domain-containing protein [Phycisphaerales bacterium]
VLDIAPWVATLSVIGILYTALICWVQEDLKKLIAYSSVSHLGFCVLGLFAMNTAGGTGSVMYMINHGLSTGALFLCVGMIYERLHTRDMNLMSGLARSCPSGVHSLSSSVWPALACPVSTVS